MPFKTSQETTCLVDSLLVLFIIPWLTRQKFTVTASPSLHEAGQLTLHYTSYLWCRPYLDLQPCTSFVLDDGTGGAVGYLLGCPNTQRFAAQIQEIFLPSLDATRDVPPPIPGSHEVQFANDPALWAQQELYNNLSTSLVKSDVPELLRQYPAHLHIDILPSHQGKGYGPKLLEAWENEMRDLGVRGCHLGMDPANQAAGRFYERQGWRTFDEVVDGDSSGEKGRERSGGVILVKKF
jgi:GNAT superfamily N-acetyltransferase